MRAYTSISYEDDSVDAMKPDFEVFFQQNTFRVKYADRIIIMAEWLKEREDDLKPTWRVLFCPLGNVMSVFLT